MQIDIVALVAFMVSILSLVSFFILRVKDAIDEGKRRGEIERMRDDINGIGTKIKNLEESNLQTKTDIGIIMTKLDYIADAIDKLNNK